MEGLQASPSQLRAAALGSAEEGLGPAAGLVSKWDLSLFRSSHPRNGGCRMSRWSHLGKKAEPYSIQRNSDVMLSICKNLGLNVNKCLPEAAFCKLRQRQEGRRELDDSLGGQAARSDLHFLCILSILGIVF